MKQRKRIYYSAAQRAEIWDRWKASESMSSIGRRFDRESSSVFSVLSPTGGIRPPDRRRADRALSLGSPGHVRLSQPAICSGVGLLPTLPGMTRICALRCRTPPTLPVRDPQSVLAPASPILRGRS